MKTQTKLLAVLLVLAICLVSWQTINAADDKDKKAGDEWDALLEGNADVSEEARAWVEAEAARGGPGMGRGGMGPGGDMGRGRGAPGMGRGGMRGGFGGGFSGRWGMVDEATLHDFLVEFEPTLAAKLEALSVDNPDRFNEQLPTLLRLYSPVIRQMERDPEGGKLSLKKIPLRLKIQKIVAKAKDANKTEKTKVQKQLRKPVGQLFDIIIEEEGLRLAQSAERLEGRSGRGGRGTGAGRGRRTGMGANRGAGRGPGMGRDFGPEMFRNRIEERKTAIKFWQESKEQIVTDRTKQLLGGYEEFPWGR